MKSVLDFAIEKIDSKTLNLIVICHGNTDSVNSCINSLQNLLGVFLVRHSAKIYDSDKLYRAEVHPEFLSKNTMFRFQTNKDYFNKLYYVFFNVSNYDLLWDYLFSPSNVSIFEDAKHYKVPYDDNPYFSKQRLFNLINDASYKGDFYVTPFTLSCDFSIDYFYEKSPNGESFARIGLHINPICVEHDLNSVLCFFNHIVSDLDSHHPDAFHSAYISYNYKDASILHQVLYSDYNRRSLNTHILGAEWSVYITASIATSNASFGNDLYEIADIVKRENGLQYTLKEDIKAIDYILRQKINKIFSKLIIPSYSHHSWHNLRMESHNIPYLPQCISLFYEKHSSDDPRIVFSFNMNRSDLCSIKELSDYEYCQSFSLKESD